MKNVELTTIGFSEWRRQIAPLWGMESSSQLIQHTANGHGQMQYVGREQFRRVILFPIAAELEGRRIAWTSTYNISDEAVRVRGIYVLPEFRDRGIGHLMTNHALALWPAPWKRCFMYAWPANVARYERWGFAIAPGHEMRTEADGTEMVLMQKELRT